MRCAELALELDEPLAGTAPGPAPWELVERLMPLDSLRGRTTLQRHQQAAEILLRRALGLEALDDAQHVEGTTFDTPRGRYSVRVEATALEPRRVSCRDDKVESPTAWSLAEL